MPRTHYNPEEIVAKLRQGSYVFTGVWTLVGRSTRPRSRIIDGKTTPWSCCFAGGVSFADSIQVGA
jgi:hypothetical protein